jgi:hypothetical protein
MTKAASKRPSPANHQTLKRPFSISPRETVSCAPVTRHSRPPGHHLNHIFICAHWTSFE